MTHSISHYLSLGEITLTSGGQPAKKYLTPVTLGVAGLALLAGGLWLASRHEKTARKSNPVNKAKRFVYIGQCDKLRRAGAEAAWQYMMSQSVPLSRKTFLAETDLAPLLDDGETPSQWLANAKTFRSEWHGSPAVFVQSDGFEFIFVDRLKANPISGSTSSDHSYPIEDLAEFVEIAEESLGVETEDEVYGCGAHGCASPLRNGKGVLKLTLDENEANAISAICKLPAHERQGFVKILIPPKRLVYADRPKTFIWAYVRENVEPLDAGGKHISAGSLISHMFSDEGAVRIEQTMNRLAVHGDRDTYVEASHVFESEYPKYSAIAKSVRAMAKRGLLMGDMAPFNFGKTENGTIVFFDPEAFHVQVAA